MNTATPVLIDIGSSVKTFFFPEKETLLEEFSMYYDPVKLKEVPDSPMFDRDYADLLKRTVYESAVKHYGAKLTYDIAHYVHRCYNGHLTNLFARQRRVHLTSPSALGMKDGTGFMFIPLFVDKIELYAYTEFLQKVARAVVLNEHALEVDISKIGLNVKFFDRVDSFKTVPSPVANDDSGYREAQLSLIDPGWGFYGLRTDY